MVHLVAGYLAMRRGLGFELKSSGRLLLTFAEYADGIGHRGPVTTDLATAWAAMTKAGPDQVARRLAVVRQFARQRAVVDPATEVAPTGLFGRPTRRKPPHVYSEAETDALLRAAAALRPRGGLRAPTYVALFSLLATTGLRIAEARRLNCRDVDLQAGVITVREGKCRKSRFVPLHPTAVAALTTYAALRHGYAPNSVFLFRTSRAPSLAKGAVEATFCYLRERLGWTAHGRARLPRIHDLRHTFAVRRLLRWYEDGADVDRKVLALATYLGHARVSDTYWYLSAVPELLYVVSKRFEHFARQAHEGKS